MEVGLTALRSQCSLIDEQEHKQELKLEHSARQKIEGHGTVIGYPGRG